MITYMRSLNSPRTLKWVFVIFLLAPLDYWLFVDRTVLPWDQAYYADMSIRISATFFRSIPDGLRLAANPLPERTPGLAWLGSLFAPLGTLSSNPAHGVLLLTLILSHLNLLLLWTFLERNSYSSAVSALVVAFAACGSLFIGLGQTFFTEPLLLTGVLLSLLTTFTSTNPNTRTMLPYQALAFLLATLAKLMAPIYFVPSLAQVLLSHARATDTPTFMARIVQRRSMQVALLAYACFLAWLVRTSYGLVQRAMFSTTGSIAAFYGSHVGFVDKFRYWFTQLLHAYTTHLVVYIFFLCILLTFFFKEPISQPRPRRSQILLSFISFLEIAFCLILFSLSDNEDTRFLYALMPYVAVILATFIVYFSTFVRYIFIVLFSMQYIFLWSYLFGFLPAAFHYNPYASPLNRDDLSLTNISALIAATCPPTASGYYNIVGVEMPTLNHNSLTSYAHLWAWPSLPSCSYTSLGYMESNPSVAYNRIHSFHAPFVIFPEHLPRSLATDPLNQLSILIHERISQDSSYVAYPGLDNYHIWFNRSYLSIVR